MEEDKLLMIIKICFIIVILTVTLIAGIVPQKWKKCRKSEHFLSIANTFSGGVFMAIAFVHIIPETTALYYKWRYQQDHPSVSFSSSAHQHSNVTSTAFYAFK